MTPRITLDKIKLHYDIIRLKQVLDVGFEERFNNYKLSASMCLFIISWLTDEKHFLPPDSKIDNLISIFLNIQYSYESQTSRFDRISYWKRLISAIRDHYEILNRLMSAIDIK
jgi:hypothetical protein